MRKIALIGLLLMCIPMQSWATHIIGGEIIYRCLGGNDYAITMYVYRDCGPNNADFDINAVVTIRNDTGVFANLHPVLRDTVRIPGDIYDPCFEVPLGVCVVRGTYVIDRITLPPRSGGYSISYQRCCRNHSIRNILKPEDYGITLTTNIPDPSLASCNNSAYFVNRPPLAICLGSEFKFDHSAIDIDGDSLVYGFCDPLHGGGPNNVQGPNGPRPDTASAPPYQTIVWNTGYSMNNPIDGNPPFIINPTTGEITGSPNRLGQYVFAVCVKEYRNGVHIGSSRREYQINIKSCESNTTAKFDIPPVCEGLTVSFKNTSITSRTFLWDFGVAAISSDTSLNEHPSFTFPDSGSYLVRLAVNRQYKCADTVELTITVFPKLKPDILPFGSRCVSNPVFDFSGVGQYENYSKFLWTFEGANPSSSSELAPKGITYTSEGRYPVKLTMTHGPCSASKEVEALVAPHPILKYAIRANDGCAPLALQLEDYSTAWTQVHRIWRIGEAVYTDSLVQQIIEKPGKYIVGLSIYTTSGCIDTIPPVYKIFDVNPSPTASFSLQETELSIFNPVVEMNNHSIGASECIAYFGNELETKNCNEKHEFSKPGTFRISQLVTNEFGCTDTASEIIHIKDEFAFFVPNSFTPNHDGKNEVFKPIVVGVKQYSLRIIDRWGSVVFETQDPEAAWEGNNLITGEPSPIGTYVYKIEVKNFLDETKVYTGNLHLIR